MADENRLIQILFNLVHNAIKFTNEGTIAVRAVAQDGKADISVEDMGVGMDAETLQRIFKPYEQGDSSMTAAPGGGIGLGIGICKQFGGAARRNVRSHLCRLMVQHSPFR